MRGFTKVQALLEKIEGESCNLEEEAEVMDDDQSEVQLDGQAAQHKSTRREEFLALIAHSKLLLDDLRKLEEAKVQELQKVQVDNDISDLGTGKEEEVVLDVG
jgi:hypothetical protein